MEHRMGKVYASQVKNSHPQPSHSSAGNNIEVIGTVNRNSNHDVMNLNLLGQFDPNVTAGARPVLNYSIQTGEEFALEFMWERVNPRQQYIASPYIETNTQNDPPVQLRRSHVAPVKGLDASSLPSTGKSQIHEPVRSGSLVDNKAGVIPVQTTLQNTRSSHGFESRSVDSLGGSNGTLKLLCSFGGKVLPRPSDRKLRYVGGETKIIRIAKNVSWVELKKKTFSLYSEPHTIKYQLPGEDLDALISVSADEDVLNMMDECQALDGAEQKLRMFLISNAELEEAQLIPESDGGEVYSDAEYVVAVNGMDVGSRRNSVALESHLAQSMDDYLLSLSKETKTSQNIKDSDDVSSPSPNQCSPMKLSSSRDWVPPNISQEKAEETRGIELHNKNVSEKIDSPGNISEIKHEDISSVSGDDKTIKSDFVSAGDESDNYHKDVSYEPDNLPQRTFHSERLHREQAGPNRLSKSGDSSSPWFLKTHSDTDVSEQKIKDLNSISTGVNSIHVVEKQIEPKKLTDESNGTIATASASIFRNSEQSTSENPQDNSASQTQINPTNKKEDEGKLQTSERIYSLASPARDKPLTSATNAEHGDILIDINDRFPRDFLSDMFSEAGIAERSSSVTLIPGNNASGANVNIIVNHEPKQRSIFQELSQHDSKADNSRLDVSLMDQDHYAYTYARSNTEGGMTVDYGYPASKAGENETTNNYDSATRPNTTNVQSDYDLSQTTVPQSSHAINSRTAGSDYEVDTRAAQQTNFPLLDSTPRDIDHKALQIIKNIDLEELRELGSGTFGTVYHGKWRGSDVAIKRIKKSCFMGRSSEQEKLTADFWHEANILSKLHHPNVVAFYGVVRDGPGGTLATVTEYMVNGSLRRALISKERHLDRRKRLLIAMDAAFGMEYLHSRNIVHFDLKCDNLLVNLKDPSRPICKVGDFGLSKIKRNTLVTGGVRGTLPWMAPELLSGSSNKVSEKVDVFSFGIVLWEILTGEEPYANMHYGAIIGGIVNNTLRPPIPSYCDPDWRLLMEQCWAPDPQDRPSFTNIARHLRIMSAASVAKPQVSPTQNQQSKS